MNSGAAFRSFDVFPAAFVDDSAEHEDKITTTAKAARTHRLRPVLNLTSLSVSLREVCLTLRTPCEF